MNTEVKDELDEDAYTRARRVAEGCQHLPFMRCKCGVPFWLREASKAERARWYLLPGDRAP